MTNADEISYRKRLHAEAFWRRGILEWKLRPIQQKIKADIARRKSRKAVVHCSRRIGKSYLLVTAAIEYAIKQPKWPVRYVAPTRVGLRQIIHPIFREIVSDCPEPCKPVWNSTDNQYQLPNGGVIHLSGVNNGHEDDPRGTAAGLCIVDEAGFVDDLSYVVRDVLIPQTINTGGYVILSSSSPRTPAHDFVEFIQEAELNGDYSKYDIHQSDYPTDVISEFIREAGGEKSSTWQREYLCKLIVDESSAICPEWKDEYVQAWPRSEFFKFYQLYESMDVGGRDKNAVLFGYYDFTAAKLILEGEYVLEGPSMTTETIAYEVKKREKSLWGERSVHCRVADNNNVILLNDLQSFHKLPFYPTTKDDLEAMVNQLRLWVNQGRVIISPECKETINCLRYGIWNDRRSEFARSRALGHYDALAALIYMVRNIDQHTNPIPPEYGISRDTHWIPQDQTLSKDLQTIKDLFGPKVGV
jgi:hypothetical protein